MILLTGATGLVGQKLKRALQSSNQEVVCSSRKPAKGIGDIQWNPEEPALLKIDLSPYQHIVHLAGENISGARWTKAFKERLWKSRISSTQILVDQILKMKTPPASFICASAVGYYGNQDEAICSEQSSRGLGFLSELCEAWESETSRLVKADIRVVNLRIGIVLSTEGGALTKMLPAFKWGLGGSLGSGNQWMSWIDIEDLIQLILFSLEQPSIRGPLNCVSPNPVRNSEFTATLAKLLHRPVGPRAPEWVLRAALGEMAEALLLASIRVEPRRALKEGFKFKYSNLRDSLSRLLTNSIERGGLN